MRTFIEMTLRRRHRHGHRPAAGVLARLSTLDPRRQDGFLLIEVMISALLVGLIVTATFNGLDVATRITTDQRHRAQASLLAAQALQQLRSEPATALDVLETKAHKYNVTLGGTIYTVTQEAKAISASGNTTGCNATESTAQTGANVLVTARVGWAQQKSSNRPEVKQGSIITPPTGSAIEVDDLNGLGEGVEGVTAKAEFIPNEAGSYNTVEGTTGSGGCVVLTGIQATSAKIYIIEKPNFVTPSGALKVEPKELTIAPNITTHYAIQYAEGGRIEAKYTYKGASEYGGKVVKSDGFVAYNGEVSVAPDYEAGSTSFEYKSEPEEKYEALNGLFSASAFTAAGTKYPSGRLWDYKGAWTVYAGDCPANKVSVAEPGAVVTAGATTRVNVPLSYTKLSVYTGVSSGLEPGELDKEAIKETGKNVIKITNSSCSGAEKPLRAFGAVYTHEQKETLTEGRLENPFQPFGSFAICLYEPKQKRTYTTTYTNSEVNGSTPAFYLKQKTAAEREKEISEAKTAKEARESEEKAAEKAKEIRVNEEATAKSAKGEREAVEKGESKYYWEKLKAEGKITAAQLTAKEKSKATLEKEQSEGKITKATREADEKTTETKAYWEKLKGEGSISATQLTYKEKTKATIESENAAAATAKTNRENEEAAAVAPREARKTAETAAEAAKKTRETRETAEAANKVTVESNKTSC
jgi:Tfp pilus assembly protein PilV